jgi:DNA-directed RNA polymerase I, II, and III subunit RPABC1
VKLNKPVRTVNNTAKMSNDEDRQLKQREAGEREAARLWRAWRTVHEMVQDRGYELSDEEVKITLDEFKSKFGSADGSIEFAPATELSLRPSY